jgi:hypothetical protein
MLADIADHLIVLKGGMNSSFYRNALENLLFPLNIFYPTISPMTYLMPVPAVSTLLRERAFL